MLFPIPYLLHILLALTFNWSW